MRCYATDDASLVVHRSADGPGVNSLSHAPSGRSIPTGSPDPLIGLANRLSRMTDWAALGATTGIDKLSPRSGGESSGSSTISNVGSGWDRRRPGRSERFRYWVRLEQGPITSTGSFGDSPLQPNSEFRRPRTTCRFSLLQPAFDTGWSALLRPPVSQGLRLTS